VTAGNMTESLNDERMLRLVDRRSHPVHQQITVHPSSTSAAVADVPAGLQQLLGNTAVMFIIYLLTSIGISAGAYSS